MFVPLMVSGGDSCTNKWMSVHEGSALTGGERGASSRAVERGRREERERERALLLIDSDF